MRAALGTAMVALALTAACGGDAGDDVTTDTAPEATDLGQIHSGQYNLGPVEFAGSFWNSCAPYAPQVEEQAGTLLAGMALKFNGNGVLCDACVKIDSAAGKSITARIITTGDTHAPGDIDLSQAAYAALDSGEYPRKMTWELVKCGAPNGNIEYQFQTEANPDWTSLWVRNGRLPIRSLEVKSANHAEFSPLTRGDDGTLTDAAGFGGGGFTLRVTAYDGQVVTDTFPSFPPGGLLTSSAQFQ
jgi:expansin (peptidoglycan-binding protein)